jgi:DNA-directed RNA polymerase specialized sigma54-like protein
MTHTLKTQLSQKTTTALRLDQKLVTSLQILQMPVKELEQFIEEKLVLNPLIPLELLKSKELLLDDLGIAVEDCAADPLAENLFWQSLFQNETEKSVLHDPCEVVTEETHNKDTIRTLQNKELFHPPSQHGELDIDLLMFFQGSKWKIVSFQPYEALIEKTLLSQKTRETLKAEHAPFWKELVALQYALSSRKNLLVSIGEEIAAHWNSIFQNQTITPLDLNKTAATLGRHRTTLFRAVKGKNLFTPQGIIALDTLFEGIRAKKAKERKKIKK